MASIYHSMSDSELDAELASLEAVAQALRDKGLKV